MEEDGVRLLLRRNPHKAMTMADVRYVVTGIQPSNTAWNDDRFVLTDHGENVGTDRPDAISNNQENEAT